MAMDSGALCNAKLNSPITRTALYNNSSPDKDPTCHSQILQTRSLDLLRLQLDSLPIDKYALPLVRLRYPPLPDLRRELMHYLFLHSFQQYPSRLWCACFHA